MTDLPKDLPPEALLEYRLRVLEGRADLMHKTINEFGEHLKALMIELERSIRESLKIQAATTCALIDAGLITDADIAAAMKTVVAMFQGEQPK